MWCRPESAPCRRKRRTRSASGLLSALRSLEGADMNPLTFVVEQQQCTEWCWAAVTAAVCQCYGDETATLQCEVVNLVLQLPTDSCTECKCRQNQSAPCNQQHNLASALDTVNHDRGNPVDGIATLGFDQVKDEIDQGHPIVVRVTLDELA